MEKMDRLKRFTGNWMSEEAREKLSRLMKERNKEGKFKESKKYGRFGKDEEGKWSMKDFAHNN